MDEELNKNTFETTGLWFLPELPDQKSYGKLRIKNNKIELELLGGLQDLILLRDKTRVVVDGYNEPEYTTVLGQTSEGYVVLKKNHFGKSMSFKGGFTTTSETFSRAIVSEENILENHEKIEFQEIELKFIRLKDFIGESKITTAYRTDDKKIIGFEAIADVKDFIFKEYTSAQFNFKFGAEYKYRPLDSDPIKNHVSIQEIPVVSINSIGSSINVDSAIDLLFSLRNFIAFALRDAIYPLSLVGVNKSSGESKVKSKTRIYFADREYPQITKSDNYNTLLSLKKLDKFGETFEQWQDSEEKFKVIHNNFFGKMYNKNQYWENQFLSLVTAIETYINLTLKTSIVSEKNKEIINDISDAEKHLDGVANMQIQEFLKGRLNNFKSDTSLKMKFSKFIETLPSNLKTNINSNDLEVILKLRHSIAHGGITQKLIKKAFERKILRKLNYVVEYTLLKTIGFSNSDIDELITII